MRKIVSKRLSNKKLTQKQKESLLELAKRPDRETDTSEIPELPETFWQNAVRNPFYRPLKQQLTLRLDADVVAWLRREGRGYQTRANATLRAAMLDSVGRNVKKKGGRSRLNETGSKVRARRQGN